MPERLCFETIIDNLPVRLHQQGKDRFAVTYWLQTKDNLSYEDATHELGAAIMHALACEGKLDNRERGES